MTICFKLCSVANKNVSLLNSNPLDAGGMNQGRRQRSKEMSSVLLPGDNRARIMAVNDRCTEKPSLVDFRETL